VLAAWQARAGKTYFVVSEKATSQVYSLGLEMLGIRMNEDFSTGFALNGVRIVDGQHDVNVAKFSDVSDPEFITQNGIEYISTIDTVLIREDFLPELTLKTKTVVIGTEGYAQYYNIGAETEDKTLVIDMPPGAAFAVYDAEGECVEFTTVTGNNSAVLPAKGQIVLVGEAGDTFTWQYK
jgi:hypothetical protein